jgi:hypothetical protein
MTEICPFCEGTIDQATDLCACPVVCPCGCKDQADVNCIYDTPNKRHLKNILNRREDEAWVIAGRKRVTAGQPHRKVYVTHPV